jgi:uncharacterized protein YjiS (DUF1127 family)
MTHIALTLSNYLHSPIAELIKMIRALFSKTVNVLDESSEEYIKRRDIKVTIKQLEALSDEELRDVGICRGDIEDIAHGRVDRRW